MKSVNVDSTKQSVTYSSRAHWASMVLGRLHYTPDLDRNI